MSEPRQRARPRGPHFPTTELSLLLSAFGDVLPTAEAPQNTPLPETIRLLDEIITDYILETCHVAALPAQLSQRSKIKLDDFKFALRRDPRKLGRMTELLGMQKEIARRRQQFQVEDGKVPRGAGAGGSEDGRKGKRGRRKKVKDEDGEDGDADGDDGVSEGGRSAKKRKIDIGDSDGE